MKKILKTRKARKTLRKVETLKKIANTGKIFSVEFIKKNGETRRMTCRAGVKKYLRGGVNTTRHIPKYLTVYSMQDRGYRNININTTKKIKFAGEEIKF